jgi:hypothetical protein
MQRCNAERYAPRDWAPGENFGFSRAGIDAWLLASSRPQIVNPDTPVGAISHDRVP